ncbi:aquaporin-like protein [Punctularia strigosozonata HHB-11173 SS5]|uniref:Aquaporin-like protein n=1 Tax=Punctularia strigosozonata (strain HHB-11173) TaxID=741275 RepID=R7S2M0_PUNST|nr:aquaporin-like protein [Punctularia strigosozonata HHB-11173 SS5]EIN04635.1 aquaporin-like protein [Punctularia strigosozonata HHB-11173 SS5]
MLRRGALATDLQAAALEYVGTTTFLLLFFGAIQAVSVQDPNVASSPIVETQLYIATSGGISLLISAWLFFRVTGAIFNPNVALALVLCKIISPIRFVLFCIAQLLGGITAAALILALTSGATSSNTTLGPNINSAQGVFIEMFITAALCLAVLMLAAEKHIATPFAPVGIGLTLFAGLLFAIPYTGGSMNAARSFGPAVVSGFPHGNHWIYWVGPGLGSLLAVAIYWVLK